jgi:hypothetical protein
VTTASGPVRVTLGWGNEPARTGAENFVQVALAAASGAPVDTPPGALAVQVSFGPAVADLPLVRAGRPGQLRAALVPTRPGTYAFHVTGTVRGRAVDASATCSDRTFDCVTDSAEVQFPVKEPSNSQLAQRLARELPRAQRASDTADSARALAAGALAMAALALVAALGLGVRLRRRKSGSA